MHLGHHSNVSLSRISCMKLEYFGMLMKYSRDMTGSVLYNAQMKMCENRVFIKFSCRPIVSESVEGTGDAPRQ